MMVIRRVICLDGDLSRLQGVEIITRLPSNSEMTQQVCESSVSLLSHDVREFNDLEIGHPKLGETDVATSRW